MVYRTWAENESSPTLSGCSGLLGILMSNKSVKTIYIMLPISNQFFNLNIIGVNLLRAKTNRSQAPYGLVSRCDRLKMSATSIQLDKNSCSISEIIDD